MNADLRKSHNSVDESSQRTFIWTSFMFSEMFHLPHLEQLKFHKSDENLSFEETFDLSFFHLLQD